MARSSQLQWIFWAALGYWLLDGLRKRAAAQPAAPGLTFKEGVQANFAPEITRILPAIEEAHRAAGVRAPVVTSGTEGHVTGLHPLGLAIDLRTRDLTVFQTDQVIAELRARLPATYQIVDESRTSQPHIHIEFDPR